MNRIFHRKFLVALIVAIALLSGILASAKDYSVTAGNWQVDFNSNETLYTSVDYKAPENSSDIGYYMIWVNKDQWMTPRQSSIFLYDYSPNFAPTSRRWMETYTASLITGFNKTPSISEYNIDDREAFIAEGWSDEFEKFTYGAMYPLDPTPDNAAQKFVGYASNLDKMTTFAILDSLHVEYTGSSQDSKTPVPNSSRINNDKSSQATMKPVTSQAVGTRENPLPMGTTVDLSDGWQVTVLSVIPDATNEVMSENQFNDPPQAGNQFFLARIKAKYTGSSSDTFDGSYRFRAVGPSSVGYTTFENSAGVIPDPLPDSEVFSGGIIEGNVGWEIKSNDADSLVMYDSPMSFEDSSNRIYMALYGS